jgi:hypothetical protein
MISFSQDATFNLQRIDSSKMNKNVARLLVEDEQVIGVYRTVRDQVIFTNLRVITAEVEGVTGKRQEIFSLPYCKIQYFGIQTVGFAELIPDAELALYFNNGLKASFEFQGSSNILEIGKMISKYSLN